MFLEQNFFGTKFWSRKFLTIFSSNWIRKVYAVAFQWHVCLKIILFFKVSHLVFLQISSRFSQSANTTTTHCTITCHHKECEEKSAVPVILKKAKRGKKRFSFFPVSDESSPARSWVRESHMLPEVYCSSDAKVNARHANLSSYRLLPPTRATVATARGSNTAINWGTHV